MASSPAEFLTFYRTLVVRRTLPAAAALRVGPRATFTTSVPRAVERQQKRKTGDLGENNRNINERRADKDPNLQAYESNKGIENREDGTGGHATEQRDATGAKAQTKKDFPEAPVTIGMEDERGGKGV